MAEKSLHVGKRLALKIGQAVAGAASIESVVHVVEKFLGLDNPAFDLGETVTEARQRRRRGGR